MFGQQEPFKRREITNVIHPALKFPRGNCYKEEEGTLHKLGKEGFSSRSHSLITWSKGFFDSIQTPTPLSKIGSEIIHTISALQQVASVTTYQPHVSYGAAQ